MSTDGLMDFQRATVDYVLRRLYGDLDPGSRFLVADEVGMGKTLVARGVIAGAIEQLEADDDVQRIDIIYICSNADIARQNIAKLDVVGGGARPLSTRISMLATQIGDLNRPSSDGRKVVNLVAFTPGTSFSRGHATGQVTERALLFRLTRGLIDGGTAITNALREIFIGSVRRKRWDREVDWLSAPENAPDEGIAVDFSTELADSELLDRLKELVDATTGRDLPSSLRPEQRAVIGDLRHLLARVSIAALEPDLVILDEFQRFKHLLDHPDDGNEDDVSQLAHDLFTFENVKVLLLSATPYKALTLPEEEQLTGDQHYSDLHATVRFLAYPGGPAAAERLRNEMAVFRDGLISGADVSGPRDAIQQLLLKYMSRTERPTLGEANMVAERLGDVRSPQAGEFEDFVGLRRLAMSVGAQLSMEYWKSSPYFVNFMDGYQLSSRLREHLQENAEPAEDVADALSHVQALTRAKVDAGEIAPGNARLRALSADTIGADMWKLLWLPPSMPYYSPLGAYKGADPTTTKRLIFSSWAAAPSAIASLLSHAALEKMNPSGSDANPRLTYDLTGDRPDGMTTLALTLPIPRLAVLADPLELARNEPAQLIEAEEALKAVSRTVHPLLGRSPRPVQGRQAATWFWAAPLRMAEGDPTDLYDAMSTSRDSKGLRQHLRRAEEVRSDDDEVFSSHPPDLSKWVAMVALAGPGNCAWRAFTRLTSQENAVTEQGVMRAAAHLAESFRALFNRSEVIEMLERDAPPAQPYWQTALEYCFAGNLQSVFDEYLHGLMLNERPRSDDDLFRVAQVAAEAVAFGSRSRLHAFDPTDPDQPIGFPTRFAVRYGNATGTTQSDDQSTERLSDVRAAFNSPFWPMVLASTSVGQEGVDFHWWCHSLVHWNQPANVVDLEQREGRVNRFRGHAVRKNVGDAHRASALRSTEPDPWTAAFLAAKDDRPDGMNDLWPSWVYPGAANVECWTPFLPLSKEIQRAERLRRDRALYRIAFGQPRQEDLIELLARQGLGSDEVRLRELRIDLRPPGG